MVLEAVNESVSCAGWGGGYFVLFRAVSSLESSVGGERCLSR